MSNNFNEADDLFAQLGLDFGSPVQAATPAVKETVKVTPQQPQVVPVQVKKEETLVPLTEEAAPIVSAGSSLSSMTQQEIQVLAQSGITKLHSIENEVNNLFVERDAVIRDLIRALVVGQHMLLLGPPGTAKSKLAREICSRIVQGMFFEWLLNRTSDPAEILGPYSIKAMEQDKFLRKVKGKLPEAHIAFIDEIYKCNEPTLNILLPLLNERIFHNDGKAIGVPLISVIAASNEEPDDDSLKALHDRLVFRTVVNYVKDPGSRQKMHQNYVAELNGGTLRGNKTTVTLQELEAVRMMAKSLTVAPNVYKVFAKLLNTFEKQGIVVSDRRQNECYKIMQGNALYFGRNQVVLDDLNALKSVLWEQQKDIQFVSTEIDKLVNPFDDEMATLWRKAQDVISNINKIQNPNDRCGASIEGKQRLEEVVKKMNTCIKDAQSNGKDVADYIKKRDSIVAENQKLVQDAIGLNLNDIGLDLGKTNMPF